MNAYETLLYEVDADGVATLAINRPSKRNSMSPQVHRDMTAALEELRYDNAVRVLVMTGAGEAFCAGMDLKEFFGELRSKPAEFERVSRMASEWYGRTLRFFPKPTIAMINGFCFGGGFGIIEGCDLAIAAEEAIFGLSEINFGSFPGGAVSKALANLLRPRDALFYAMTGRTFDGKRAAEIGLVNFSVPQDALKPAVMDIAREVAGKNSHALTAIKNAYRHSLDMSWDAAVAYAAIGGDALAHRQKDIGWQKGVDEFVKGEFKPGLEGNPVLRDA